MKSYELTQQQLEEISHDELMRMQLQESFDDINMSITKINNRTKHFIGLCTISILFLLLNYHMIGLALFIFCSIIMLFVWKEKQHLKSKITIHKALILFFKSYGIANTNNWYIIEKYKLDR
jgi:hypothetical protein